MGYDDGELESEAAAPGTLENLRSIAEYDGNLVDLMDEESLRLLGQEAKTEYDADVSARAEWLEGYNQALKATQQDRTEKNYPFAKASNINVPILTAACIQFNARSYAAITRSDQPVQARPQGKDKGGRKAARADRLGSFLNHQLMRECDEWVPGTDRMTMVLPMGGTAFRKVHWARDLARPVLDMVTADKVVLPSDAASFDRSPRVTEPCIYYPYEIRRLIERGDWANHAWQKQGATDSQKPVQYLEQQRYIDLDGDGLQEPYLVTVHNDTASVVRIEAGFQLDGLMVSGRGDVETIKRESPLIHYYFLPSPDGSVYGMGFGQLLESLGAAINSQLNQIIDAGHRHVAGGGFIAQGLRMRGGEHRMKPGEFKFINAPSNNIRDAVYEMQFAGPSPTSFQTLEFLLGLSQDITSVKDILTGQAPSGQAMGATLALIEQGLQVSSTIYTRIYRSEQRELSLLMRLNRRHLDPKIYAEFLDDEELLGELLKKTGSAPAAMSAITGMQAQMNGQPPPMGPPGMPGMGMPGMGQPDAPQKPQEWTTEALDALMEDFDQRNMDVVLGADPKSVTDMQRMMRAEYLRQDLGKPGVNNTAILKRVWTAAGIENVDELLSEGPDPMQELEVKGKAAEVEKTVAEARTEKAKGVKTMNEAELARQEGMEKAFGRGVTQAEMAGGVGGVADPADGAGVPGGDASADAGGAGGLGAPAGEPEPEP